VRYKILIIFLLAGITTLLPAQVKIRLFANQFPESAIFSVVNGSYEINLYNGKIFSAYKDEPVMIIKFENKLVVKKRNEESVVCDSLIFTGKSGNDSFSIRLNVSLPVKQFYNGDLQCFPDFGTLLFINISDIEKYITGVVLAEGGSGHNIEFFKAQAIIARTYMYKHFDKHLSDKYNVCDNTHCQAFNGLSGDSVLNKAVYETRDLVILDNDGTLITAAFHSNCGGETSTSDEVWISGHNYLKAVTDPYCTTSRSATWRKSISKEEWISALTKSSYKEGTTDLSVFNFEQKSRLTNYRSGSFSVPLRTLRENMNLRSTFFSVEVNGDSVILNGRGYGHGVGLCQEGAMTMALKGFRYKDIINFYYSGVTISDIKNAVALH
jgi:stage II sporulation protein D